MFEKQKSDYPQEEGGSLQTVPSHRFCRFEAKSHLIYRKLDLPECRHGRNVNKSRIVHADNGPLLCNFIYTSDATINTNSSAMFPAASPRSVRIFKERQNWVMFFADAVFVC